MAGLNGPEIIGIGYDLFYGMGFTISYNHVFSYKM